jgi:hypothetical protein
VASLPQFVSKGVLGVPVSDMSIRNMSPQQIFLLVSEETRFSVIYGDDKVG